MRSITDLRLILEDHASWLDDSATGRRADLTGCVLCRADLTGADLTEADLTGADLTGADLTEADLTEADLAGCVLCGATIDGARVRPEDIGGPGEILCALTPAEWERVRAEREEVPTP